MANEQKDVQATNLSHDGTKLDIAKLHELKNAIVVQTEAAPKELGVAMAKGEIGKFGFMPTALVAESFVDTISENGVVGLRDMAAGLPQQIAETVQSYQVAP